MGVNGSSQTARATDQDLVQSFQQGADRAYEEIYRRYVPRVRWLCHRMLGNHQDAEEAAQETFLKAYVALERFNGRYQLKAWLSRIAINVCLDEVRSRNRSANLIPLSPEADVERPESSPEEVVTGERLRLDTTLGEIQPLHARAIVLRAQGLSHKDIAERLDMTPAQVKALLHRARRSFRRAWRSVEGWALAPVGAFRWAFGRRADSAPATHSAHLAAVANGLGPGIAERVAAAGVIVAVALTGVSQTTPSTRPAAPDAARKAPPGEAVDPSQEALAASLQARAETAESSQQGPAGTLASEATELVRRVQQAVRPEPPRREPEDEDEGETIGRPGSAGTKKAKKEVRRVLEHVPRPPQPPLP